MHQFSWATTISCRGEQFCFLFTSGNDMMIPSVDTHTLIIRSESNHAVFIDLWDDSKTHDIPGATDWQYWFLDWFHDNHPMGKRFSKKQHRNTSEAENISKQQPSLAQGTSKKRKPRRLWPWLQRATGHEDVSINADDPQEVREQARALL